MLESQHTETGSKGSFFIEKQGKKVAEMTYSKAGDTLIIIDHTTVDDSLRGQGAGNVLVESAVKWARQQSIKIIPLCPFANSVFQKHAEFRDVLK